MRSALVIPSAFETFPYAQQILEEADFRKSEELIAFVEVMRADKEILAGIASWFQAFLGGGIDLSPERSSACVTVDSGAHRDDVIGDVTIGAVLAGDHVLYTGNGREVGPLLPGTCFALCNKKLHGAKPRARNMKTKLVFAAVDLIIVWNDLMKMECMQRELQKSKAWPVIRDKNANGIMQ